jgi:hypothetical protein
MAVSLGQWALIINAPPTKVRVKRTDYEFTGNDWVHCNFRPGL